LRPRDLIKNGHENAVIEQFVSWLNVRTGRNYRIIAKPDPPDALIEYNGEHKWIEHADIYRSSEEAREEYSSVTPGEQPYIHTEHPIVSPDARIASRVYAILQQKLSKTSYTEVHATHGLGTLVLTERDPLFDESTLNEICELLDGAEYEGDKNFFEAVYLGIRSPRHSDLVFFRLYPNVMGKKEST
jgi:hypothetical protein